MTRAALLNFENKSLPRGGGRLRETLLNLENKPPLDLLAPCRRPC